MSHKDSPPRDVYWAAVWVHGCDEAESLGGMKLVSTSKKKKNTVNK